MKNNMTLNTIAGFASTVDARHYAEAIRSRVSAAVEFFDLSAAFTSSFARPSVAAVA